METKLKENLANKLIILLKNFSTAFDPEVIPTGGLRTAIVLLSYLQDIDASKICDVLTEYIEVMTSFIKFLLSFIMFIYLISLFYYGIIYYLLFSFSYSLHLLHFILFYFIC